MKKFSHELTEFLKRHYPDANQDGSYRFSADIEIRNGFVDVHLPILTRLSEELSPTPTRKSSKVFLGLARGKDSGV